MIEAQAVQAHLNSAGITCPIGTNYTENSVVICNEVIFDYIEAKGKATLLVNKAKYEAEKAGKEIIPVGIFAKV